eukprot:2451692-Rhodomonas_salina.1
MPDLAAFLPTSTDAQPLLSTPVLRCPTTCNHQVLARYPETTARVQSTSEAPVTSLLTWSARDLHVTDT